MDKNEERGLGETEALQIVDQLVHFKSGKHLNDLQREIFLGSWQGLTYKKIHRKLSEHEGRDYDMDYIQRDAAHRLWNLISDALGEKVEKKNLRGSVERARERRLIAIDTHTRDTVSLHSEVDSPTFQPVAPNEVSEQSHKTLSNTPPRVDWGVAPSVHRFYKSTEDMERLERQITVEGCRLISLFGLIGIGRTTLSVKLAELVRHDFDYLIWRSLPNWRSPARLPYLKELVADLNYFLSDQQSADKVELSYLLNHLRHHRCLIVLDGLEAVLQGGAYDGSYIVGYEDYGELLRQVGKTEHQSCLIITSLENPKDVFEMQDISSSVCSLKVEGFKELAIQDFFSGRGINTQSEGDLQELIRRYGGHPFALNRVAEILQLLSNDLSNFLEQSEDMGVMDELHNLLAHQFARLSEIEQEIMICLANNREPSEVKKILHNVTQKPQKWQPQNVLQALKSLIQRALIEQIDSNPMRFYLSSFIIKYIKIRLLSV